MIRTFVSTYMHLSSSAALRRFAAVFALVLGAVLLAQAVHAQSQPNFKPLERGDITETEQKLLVIRGIEVGGDYALRLRENLYKDMPFLDSSTTMDQDFRLRMSTVFNEDVSMKLTLQTSTTSIDPNNLRTTPVSSGQEPNGQNLQLTAREVYLQYRFNPNSAINLGRFDLELGDKRGKVYRGISSGIGCECRVGTWSMPFGATKVGPYSPDWIYHWALKYNAYDEPTDTGHRKLSVEIFRILYTENNVPLGNNLGPASYDPALGGAVATRVQLTDNCTSSSSCGQANGNPIYYDATAYNYFGLRLDWQASLFFLSFDFTNSQGSRAYHLFRDPAKGVTTGPTYTTGIGPVLNNQSTSGNATEVELGWRWAPQTRGQFGLRYMAASGDRNAETVDASGRYRSPNGAATSRGLNGYYEITPGTYQGTRLYFNGANTQVDLGGGLGHSVNNKQLYGVYFDYADPEGNKIGYSGGLYQIDLIDSVLNSAGLPVKNVGIELDNMMTLYMHKNLHLQFEANLLTSGGAMSIDDNTPPTAEKQLFVQILARAVYRF